MKKMLCFDMDGTIADLYSYPQWLEKLRNEDPEPYQNAVPLYDMRKLAIKLNNLIEKGWEIRIITWLSKITSKNFAKMTKKAKMEWLDRYGFPYQKIHVLHYGRTKADAVRKVVEKGNAILIDDNPKIRNGWTLGATIDPTNGNLLEELERLEKIKKFKNLLTSN